MKINKNSALNIMLQAQVIAYETYATTNDVETENRRPENIRKIFLKSIAGSGTEHV